MQQNYHKLATNTSSHGQTWSW